MCRRVRYVCSELVTGVNRLRNVSFSTVNHSGNEVVSVLLSQPSRCVVFTLTTDVLQVGV